MRFSRNLIEECVEVPDGRSHHYLAVRALTGRQSQIKRLEIESSLGRGNIRNVRYVPDWFDPSVPAAGVALMWPPVRQLLPQSLMRKASETPANTRTPARGAEDMVASSTRWCRTVVHGVDKRGIVRIERLSTENHVAQPECGDDGS